MEDERDREDIKGEGGGGFTSPSPSPTHTTGESERKLETLSPVVSYLIGPHGGGGGDLGCHKNTPEMARGVKNCEFLSADRYSKGDRRTEVAIRSRENEGNGLILGEG